MDTPIPYPVIQAGLAGVVISLFVAFATNNWSLRVLALLALRLAIGWHFLFEGLHKVHSTYVGPTDTNRVFSSEIYFVAAEGPLGEKMRRDWIGDPAAQNRARLTPPKPLTAAEFEKLAPEEQANLCPSVAAAEIDAGGAEKPEYLVDAKATFAKWVYGVSGRDAKVKFVTGDPSLTSPERFALIELLRTQLAGLEAEDRAGLGKGTGTHLKNESAVRADLRAAESDLAKDTDAFITELQKLAGGKAPEAKPKKILELDRMTRWGITAIGAGLLLGLFTRVWCLAGAGFLVMTYLSHPTVPWLPLPPMTEGNPLFINKNLIEALALVVIATFPTGRWLGLDALIGWACCKKPATAEA